jgi:hypothetical protein
MKKYLIVITVILIMVVGFSGCNEIFIRFNLNAKYSYIMSYRDGGGIFLINMTPGHNFYGNVSLKIDASANLNVKLNNYRLNESSRVAEITIHPNNLTRIGLHEIELSAAHKNVSRLLSLEVDIINRSIGNPSSYIIGKKNKLIYWLESEYPTFYNISNQDWFAYMTYVKILVVEHWTFLSSEWELRLCCHITIPPYNWSMLRLRKVGEIDPIFAAKCDFNDTMYEIPISDYPIIYGY